MTFEQKKALMDSKKMWRSNYVPPLLRILWQLGIWLLGMCNVVYLLGAVRNGGR